MRKFNQDKANLTQGLCNGGRRQLQPRPSGPLKILALTIALGALSLHAHANPVNPVVVHGHASFNGGVPGQLEITNQPGTIINWQDFSIGRGELTRFIQQGSLSAVLNRVTGFNASEILGQLQSNGRVFLINPNGIVFGEGSVIDTAGLVASTLDLSNDDFLSGNYNFAGDASSGDIVNRGFITSGRNGEIVLLAPKVENHGVLKVEEGQILLAAGERISLTSLDSEHISFDIEASPGEVLNLGKILADGGSAALVAASLTNTGVIQADSIGSDVNGSLWLEATESANIGGTLSASGNSSNQTGGDITITAPKLILEFADLSATGHAGGGDIRLGGDYQGSALGGGAANARTVTIDEATRINADALSDGNGGMVIIWSDDHTVVNGELSARGGQFGGDGGLVETSSAGILEFAGPASVSAVNGKPGTWLLDPEDIVIGSGEADSISAALNEGSSVSIKTSDGGDGEGNISVNAAIAKTEGGDASLSMTAHNEIDLNASITSTEGKLNVSLKAGRSVNVNASVSTNGGSFGTSVDGSLLPQDELEPEIKDAEEAEVAESVSEDSDVSEEDTSSDATEVGSLVDEIDDTDEELIEEVVAEVEEALDVDVIEEALAAIEITETIKTDGGSIEVDGGASGDVALSGTLDASNETIDAIGGDIDITGLDLVLEETAVVDASGDGGGGVIRIGGGRNGQDESIRNARSVVIEEGAEIHADAITDGDGGEVIVYGSDGITIDAVITARGGAEGGDGGFVETSSHGTLQINQVPTTAAPNGTGGEWLIDPTDYTLDAANWALLNTGLAANNVVTLQTTTSPNNPALTGRAGTGNITTSVDYESDGIGVGKTLRLFADEDVLINNSIEAGDGDSLILDIRADCTFNAATDSCTTDGSGDAIFDAEGGLVQIHLGESDQSELMVSGVNVRFLGGSDDDELLSVLTSGKQLITASGDLEVKAGDGAGANVEFFISNDELAEDGADLRQLFKGNNVTLMSGGEGSDVKIQTDIANYETLTLFDASQNFEAANDLMIVGGTDQFARVIIDQLVSTDSDTETPGDINASQNFSGNNITINGGTEEASGRPGINYDHRDSNELFVSQDVAVVIAQSSAVRGNGINVSQNIKANNDLLIKGGAGDNAGVFVTNFTAYDGKGFNLRQVFEGNNVTIQGGDGASAPVEIKQQSYYLDGSGQLDMDFTQQFMAANTLKFLGGGDGFESFVTVSHQVTSLDPSQDTGKVAIDVNAGTLEVLAGDGGGSEQVNFVNTTLDPLLTGDPTEFPSLDEVEVANIDFDVTGDATFRGGQNSDPGVFFNSVSVQATTGHVRIRAGGDITLEGGQGSSSPSQLGILPLEEEEEVAANPIANSGDDVTITAAHKLGLEAGNNVNIISTTAASVVLEGAVSGLGSTVDIEAGNEINLDNSAGGGDILIIDNFGTGTVNLTFTTCNPVGACSGPIILSGSTNTTVLAAAPAGPATVTTSTLLELLSGAGGDGLAFPVIGDLIGSDLTIDTSNLGLDNIANQLVSLITTETLADERSLAEQLEDEDSEVRSRGLLCY